MSQKPLAKAMAGKLATVLRLPIYYAQLFTGAKSFRDNPILGSTLLNRLGLHVIRLVAAAGVTRFRTLVLAPLMTKEERKSFNDDGNAEVRGMQEVEVRQCVQGDTLTQRVLLNEQVLESSPVCQQLLSDTEFLGRMKYTAARNHRPIFYVQNIKSNAVDADADPQRHLHSDTFHATMKAWLFLDDVGDHNGPFTYVKCGR